MQDLDKIIEGCKKGQRSFQKLLYDKYAPVLMGICMRYAYSTDEAEDVLQDSFVKIFKEISKFEKKGSFEGWLKRIVINTAITNYRKNQKRYNQQEIDSYNQQFHSTSMYETDYTHEELLKIIQELPDGYRIVFNLYAIEGYKHKEIAEILGIDVTTSKSQYSRAKKAIRKKMEEISKINL